MVRALLLRGAFTAISRRPNVRGAHRPDDEEWHMGSAIGHAVGRSRTRTPARSIGSRSLGVSAISILENPLVAQNPALARAIENEAQGILGSHDLGRLEVRFRVCRDERDGLKFICKVESPAPADLHQDGAQWRWWSPLMETAQEFRAALLDALEIRRQRLTAS
jgi:hypothetical protein